MFCQSILGFLSNGSSGKDADFDSRIPIRKEVALGRGTHVCLGRPVPPVGA
jgi:hypothetical protein